MEAKLFWISLSSGVYALFLRWFSKDEKRMENIFLTSLTHGLFYAGVGAVLSVLVSSYWEKPQLLWKFLVALGCLGFAGGFLWRWIKNPSSKTSWDILKDDLEWADTGFSAILLASFIMYFFIQAFKIPSGSMRYTLIEGDHLFVNKFIYGFRVPLTGKKVMRFRPVKRGEVVVFRYPSEDEESHHYGKDFIKRAIGIPGDIIEIKDKVLYVNGKPTEENYTNIASDKIIPRVDFFKNAEDFQSHWEKGLLDHILGNSVRDNFGPIKVPEKHYFVLGDNRDHSYDSRFWGPMPESYLKGRAWFVYLPFKRVKIIR